MIDEKKLIEDIIKLTIDTASELKVSEILNLIYNQPKAGEWLPCSERLPEFGMTVLIQDHEGCFRLAEREIINGIDGFGSGNWWTSGNHQYVAWMPLPELYKTKGDQ